MHFHPQHGEERIPQIAALELSVGGLKRECPWRVTGKVLSLSTQERTSAIKNDSLGPQSMMKWIGWCTFIWKSLFLL